MASQTPKSSNHKKSKANTAAVSKAATAKPSKLDRVVTLLRQKKGASLEELCTITGWQIHSVRGAIAGSLKKKGHVITSEKIDGIRRYRIGETE
ncbi:DUF3489 domain-containing protein [Sneathiella chungangensis]|uniref:DUF3489 domain-containing protein n=1 Tax=Sneathiella chungangensis TaxID=1418234 RepID=A0A845MLH0_9PROT|nr:DUF3489 domain-containing protein [Sneathiella chungangensis]MZR24335.1 DUF3489 domain-containing protein [Sneathiella chungangensis]